MGNVKGTSGGRRRTLEQIDKDARTLALHLQGKSYQEIMKLQEFRSKSSVHYGIKRALADRQKDAFEQIDHFTMAIEGLQRLIAENEAIVAAKHYAVSNTGKVVEDPQTGLPLIDDGPKQRALTELRHLRAELNKLVGNYAPAKSRVEVVTEDVVQREIDQLAKEIAEAGKNQPVPPELPR